jgi:hypothetical protein
MACTRRLVGLVGLVGWSIAPAGRTAEPVSTTLMYTGPEETKGAEMSAFDYRKFEPGEVLFVASHNTNLRAKPSAKSELVASLPMAAKVRVIQASSKTTAVIGKVDRWYLVEVLEPSPFQNKRGHLFGMVLTPVAFRADLDGDGEDEIVTAAFAQNLEIRVRIREPKVEQPDSVSIDVKAAGGAYISRSGGLAEVKLVPREQAGVGLVEVFAHVEACADFATYWISYSVPDNKPGVLGEAKLAMTQSGVADPPVHSSYAVSWDPKARTASVVQTNTEEDEQGKETESRTTTRYRLVDGVYQPVQ